MLLSKSVADAGESYPRSDQSLSCLFPPCLPASLFHTRDLAFVSQFTEADTADAVFFQYGVRTSASLTASVLANFEFLRTLAVSTSSLFLP